MRIPQERWPKDWEGYEDPVCPLVLALHGHPNSGSFWEQMFERKSLKEGFRRIGECGEWRSCYYHVSLRVILVAYVDDFKMAGPKEHIQ